MTDKTALSAVTGIPGKLNGAIDDLAAEAGQELPPLPPIPLQQEPSNGIPRRSQRPPGEWCKENGVTPPPGSFRENMIMSAGA